MVVNKLIWFFMIGLLYQSGYSYKFNKVVDIYNTKFNNHFKDNQNYHSNIKLFNGNNNVYKRTVCYNNININQFSLHSRTNTMKVNSNNTITCTNLCYYDLLGILQLAYSEFSSTCEGNLYFKLYLIIDILIIYIPKLFFPYDVMGHQIIGLKDKDNEVIGIADISMQTISGSLEALDRTLFFQRIKKYPVLGPYLCNFLISSKYRRKGLGNFLINACEIYSKDILRHKDLYLHVENISPALSFYLSNNYEPVKMVGNKVLFMKKSLNSLSIVN